MFVCFPNVHIISLRFHELLPPWCRRRLRFLSCWAFSACVCSMAEGGAQKKGKGFSHVTSPWTPLISELTRSSGHLVGKKRSDDASSFLGALLWHVCTAAGPTCTRVRLTLLKECSRVERVQFGFGSVEDEASHSGHFSSLSPFSCLLPVTRPLRDELRVMPPPLSLLPSNFH